MTTTDTAAEASIEAAACELRLPAIREQAGRIAAQAQRSKATFLGFLADILTVELDDRAERRRARRIHEARHIIETGTESYRHRTSRTAPARRPDSQPPRSGRP